MTTQHTLGPWRLDIGSIQPDFFKGKLHEAVFANDECIAVCGENQANANLIAAAPCMLEALEAFMAGMDKSKELFEGHNEAYLKIVVLPRAHAAIARAKGQS